MLELGLGVGLEAACWDGWVMLGEIGRAGQTSDQVMRFWRVLFSFFLDFRSWFGRCKKLFSCDDLVVTA